MPTLSSNALSLNTPDLVRLPALVFGRSSGFSTPTTRCGSLWSGGRALTSFSLGGRGSGERGSGER